MKFQKRHHSPPRTFPAPPMPCQVFPERHPSPCRLLHRRFRRPTVQPYSSTRICTVLNRVSITVRISTFSIALPPNPRPARHYFNTPDTTLTPPTLLFPSPRASHRIRFPRLSSVRNLPPFPRFLTLPYLHLCCRFAYTQTIRLRARQRSPYANLA